MAKLQSSMKSMANAHMRLCNAKIQNASLIFFKQNCSFYLNTLRDSDRDANESNEFLGDKRSKATHYFTKMTADTSLLYNLRSMNLKTPNIKSLLKAMEIL